MLEKIARFQRTNESIIETVVDGGEAQGFLITHAVLLPGQATPHLKAGMDLQFIVTRGTLHLQIADQIIHIYEAGTIIAVPFGVMMEACNKGTEPLEFFAVERPHPGPRLLKDAV